jgi:L-asparaginase/glutamin-(asparagin-)ase
MISRRTPARFALAVALALALPLAAAAQAARQLAPAKPTVTILATGGTIAGAQPKPGEAGYKAGSFSVESLIAAVPGMEKVAAVKGEQIASIGSQDMNDAVWIKLARRVNELQKDPTVDGIVITHGTDTLEETGYFLTLVTQGDKPVVLVGSMRPSTAISADGPINLYNAVLLAASPEAVGKGVLVAMNDQIHAGRDVSKSNTTLTDTFRTPELGMLGYFQGGKAYFYRQVVRKHTVDTEFDVSALNALPQVEIALAHANVGPVAVEAFVAAGAKGIIHAGVGNGSLPAKVRPALSAARAKGVVIVRSSRVGQGILARNGEANDDQLDFVVSDTLSPQKARILLMLALTKTSSTKEIQRMFATY